MTGFDSKRQMAQAKLEPTQWRDMIVTSLVREGIDKHKARELADHFAAQPEQEPVAGRAFLERVLVAMEGVIDVADRKTDEFDALRSCIIELTLMLYTTPLAAQPEPVAVDQPTMELAESVGLIGPASRTHDLHAAIQRFHNLICVNATIKAAQMAADAIRESIPPAAPVAWKWHKAPVKTSWGHEMFVADLGIDKDHTVSIYCERDQTAKVEAMFNPPAAQRPWQGLTDEEVQFYIKKHSKLVNAGYDKATDTNLVAKTFDSTGFYKEVSTVLKERNT
jgi:hypothetical protein